MAAYFNEGFKFIRKGVELSCPEGKRKWSDSEFDLETKNNCSNTLLIQRRAFSAPLNTLLVQRGDFSAPSQSSLESLQSSTASNNPPKMTKSRSSSNGLLTTWSEHLQDMLKRDIIVFCAISTRLDAQSWIPFFKIFNKLAQHDLPHSTLAAKLQDLFVQDDDVYHALMKFETARKSIADVQSMIKKETKLKARMKQAVRKTINRSWELSSTSHRSTSHCSTSLTALGGPSHCSTSHLPLGGSSHRDVSNETCMSSAMGGETEVLEDTLISVVTCLGNAEIILDKTLRGHEFDHVAMYFKDRDNREAYNKMSDVDKYNILLDLCSPKPRCFKVRAGAK